MKSKKKNKSPKSGMHLYLVCVVSIKYVSSEDSDNQIYMNKKRIYYRQSSLFLLTLGEIKTIRIVSSKTYNDMTTVQKQYLI